VSFNGGMYIKDKDYILLYIYILWVIGIAQPQKDSPMTKTLFSRKNEFEYSEDMRGGMKICVVDEIWKRYKGYESKGVGLRLIGCG
jgi:hypothetical protein